MKRNEDFYEYLDAELDVEFGLFALEHPEWLERNVPDGAYVVFQTDDEGFNEWARKKRGMNGKQGKRKTPTVMINVGKLRRRRSRIQKPRALLV